MQFKTVFHLYWKSIFIIAIILYLSFAPASTFKGISLFKNVDKVVHLLMYMGLAMILIYDFRNHKKTNNYTFIFILTCIIFPSLLGGFVEIMQELFFPPRSAEWSDWLCDIAGILIGWTTMHLARNKVLKIKS